MRSSRSGLSGTPRGPWLKQRKETVGPRVRRKARHRPPTGAQGSAVPPVGFDPKVHGSALKAPLLAQGFTVGGVVLAPRGASPGYAGVEPAAAVA